MNLQEEKKLIAKAQKDPQVFGEIFEKYYQIVFNYTLRRVADIKVAEDILSEVFFKALTKLWQFRWQNVPFSAWLFRIANNEINYYFRKNKYAPLSLDQMLEESGIEFTNDYDVKHELMECEKMLEEQEDFLKIQQNLLFLPLQYQETLALKYFEKKKIREIALILKKSEGTVKSLLSRGLALWKKECVKQKLAQQLAISSINKSEKSKS